MGWLLAVCRNLCLMRLRREERHAALSEEEWDAIPAREVRTGRRRACTAARRIGKPSLTRERRVVLLHAGYGPEAPGDRGVLELPLPTVLSKYHRALKKMRSFLEGDDAR